MSKEATQFKKGEIHNPNGRPKGSFSLVAMLKESLQEIPEGERKTYAKQFIDAVLEKSIKKKNVIAMKEVFNRVDGLPTQTVNLGGDGIKFVVDLGKKQ
jgi:hypothetical protein